MPSAHRCYAEWTPGRMMCEAVSSRPGTDHPFRGDHDGEAAPRAGLPLVFLQHPFRQELRPHAKLSWRSYCRFLVTWAFRRLDPELAATNTIETRML